MSLDADKSTSNDAAIAQLLKKPPRIAAYTIST
jgi:hypothetical protein